MIALLLPNINSKYLDNPIMNTTIIPSYSHAIEAYLQFINIDKNTQHNQTAHNLKINGCFFVQII
jgi:hypothetical protein